MCAQCAGRCRRELVARSEGSTVLQPTALLRTAVLGDRRGKVAATGHLLVLCLSVPQWKMSLSESWSEAFVCGNKRRGSLWALVLGGSRGTSTSQSPGPVRTWPAVGRLPPSAESGNALLHQLRVAPFCTLRPQAPCSGAETPDYAPAHWEGQVLPGVLVAWDKAPEFPQ